MRLPAWVSMTLIAAGAVFLGVGSILPEPARMTALLGGAALAIVGVLTAIFEDVAAAGGARPRARP